ncbi:MAG: PHP domain-containing protein, partial [Nanoarchaeota archaeon]|nr:PHP domain-containing protein [Nanoarchaeota archaeon]
MKIDMHVHSMYSHDSRMKPEEAINRGIELGLDGICFTEHHSYLNSGLIEGIDSKNIKVFRGAEIATDIGHILVYGVEDDSWNFWEGIEGSFMEAQKVIDAVNGIGGVCILAHPFRKDPNVDSISKLNGLVALEVFNGKNSEEEIEKTK